MTYRGPKKVCEIGSVPSDSYQILAVDPGGVTGWSMMAFPKTIAGVSVWKTSVEKILDNKFTWVHGEIECNPIDPGAKILRKLCDRWPRAAIVFEDFWIRQIAVDLAPVELISIVRHHLWMKGRKMNMQQPAMAKRLNNERLRLLGVYTPTGGLEHARDADRHVLMTIRRSFKSDFRQRIWGE